MSGKFDIGFLGWTVPVPINPNNLYACKAAPPGGQNLGRYCNHAVDALLDEMQSTYDEARYRRDLSGVLHVIADDVPVIIQGGREAIFGVNRDLQNFDPNEVTPFDDMLDVDI